MIAFGCCICLLHSMHIALVFVITVYLVSVAGIGSDPLQLNLCISPVPFSFGVWCHFCPSRVMPSDPDTVCKNGAQVSRRCLSFSPVYRFGDGHASIPDRSFILSCWQPLMILVIKKGQCQQPQFFPAILFLGRVRIFFRPLDNNVVATFVSHYMITECVLTSELVQAATWLS